MFLASPEKLATTIARLNVPYGDNGGWPAFHLALMQAGLPVPVHPDGPSRFNPIHDDDIIATLPALLGFWPGLCSAADPLKRNATRSPGSSPPSPRR